MFGPLDLSFKDLLHLLDKEHERSLQRLREENLQIRKLVNDVPKEDKISTKLVNDWDAVFLGERVGEANPKTNEGIASNEIGRESDHVAEAEELSPCESSNPGMSTDLGLHLCPVWTQVIAVRSNRISVVHDKNLVMEIFSKAKINARSRTSESFEFACARGNVLRNCPRGWSDIVMSPASRKLMVWRITAFVMLVYDFCVIPVQLAFNPPPRTHTRLLELLTIVYWTLDILVNFLTGYHTEKGKIEGKFIPIAKKYLSSNFWLDIIIVLNDWLKVAIDYLPQGMGLLRGGKFFRFMRFARSIRLVRLVRVQELIHTIMDRISAESVIILCDIATKVILLLAVNHFVTCLWFLIGTGANGWVHKADIEGGIYESYLISLHWALTSFTPAQKPLVRPTTLPERTFAVFLILFAMVFMSTFISSITSQMTRLRQLKSTSLGQSFTLRKFLKEKGIPTDLSVRITRYVQVAQKRHQQSLSRDRVELLKFLSGPLSVELQTEIYSPSLCCHPFFETYRGWSPSSMSCICYSAVHQEHYSKGDHLFSYGRGSAYMYFLSTGSLYYMRPQCTMWDNSKSPTTQFDEDRVMVVNKGQWFCEATLWVAWTHRGTMGALAESEAIQLNSRQFQEITKEHADLYQRCIMWANDFLGSLEETYQCHGCVWDLPPETIYSNANENISDCSEDNDDVFKAEAQQAYLDVQIEA